MRKRLEAVYENGVLRLLEPVDLEDHQRVTVTIEESRLQTQPDLEDLAEAMPLPGNGAELVVYWEKKGLMGTRPDITDSTAHARALRRQAETRYAD